MPNKYNLIFVELTFGVALTPAYVDSMPSGIFVFVEAEGAIYPVLRIWLKMTS
ncbi:hypothetical protein [Methylobacter sp. BBA5.1]|uniref:hypothetical protein n=1 Tax=Methylobacter sp. BBA5.1 TaxID=1495064 RepID=UPI000AA33AA1|nr:hypothetical protein [Methylobacter sp. BBA5.1]